MASSCHFYIRKIGHQSGAQRKGACFMSKLKLFCMSRGGKVFLLLVLILLFLIPAGMIRGLIYERSERASDVESEIMRAWGEDFALLGPVVRIPCLEKLEIKTTADKEDKTEIRETEFFLCIAPEEFFEDINLETLVKKRGIFSVPLFTGSVHLKGKFSPEFIQGELKENQRAFPEKAEFIVSLANMNGIKGVKNAEWNGRDLNLQAGTNGFSMSSRKPNAGIHSPAAFKMNEENTFDIVLNIQGGKSIRMVPMGKSSAFSIKADWPSPSFQGAYLPAAHIINEDGFEAQWEFSHLNQSIPLVWRDGGGKTENSIGYNDFEVDFYKAVDHYDMNTRAVKYAILFIIIPFLGFFLFELLLRRSIHMVQYLLAGIGNIIFYLLLLSLSEHIVFAAAYSVSALAVVLMVSLYSRSFLGAWGKSWIMGTVMAFLYTFLYFTLQSEDWALLIGSIGAFGITAFVMFLTRKLDW